MKRKIITIENNIMHFPQSDTIWMSGYEIAYLFECFTGKISSNIRTILKGGVLRENEACKTIPTSDGGSVELYNLKMIIALAFRIRSKNAEIFRKWLIRTVVSCHDNYLLKETHILICCIDVTQRIRAKEKFKFGNESMINFFQADI